MKSSIGISSTFLVVGQWGFTGIISGIGVLLCQKGSPDIYNRYPIGRLFWVGFSKGLSTILFNFSISGSRTPPYLQAILANFNIPIQFAISFLILGKKPTLLKCLCASVILVAELVCLIPTIFPSLESRDQKQAEGGATGVGAVLWPVCLVASQIPFAVANTLMEKNVKDTGKASRGSSREQQQPETQPSIFYFTFWWSFFITLTCSALFWVDLIPGFGTTHSMGHLWSEISFSARCMFGMNEECGGEVMAVGWLAFTFSMLGAVTYLTLMRYSEGSNFVITVLAFRTPLVFIFWTLFEENPFLWKPHVALSTYLSVVAIVVMIPAVIIYNTGLSLPSWCKNHMGEHRRLLGDVDDDVTDENINHVSTMYLK